MDQRSATTVKLHHMLYQEAAITDAAATFADFARFTIRSEGDHYVVEISEIDAQVDGDVVAEFCNFALANTALHERSRDA